MFLKTFRTFRSFENCSRKRSRRDDSLGPKIVEFRAILAIFRSFEDRNQTEKTILVIDYIRDAPLNDVKVVWKSFETGLNRFVIDSEQNYSIHSQRC